LKAFLESADKVLVCTHATFRFAVDEYGVEAFDDRLIAVDEFHHVSANPDNKLGAHLASSSPATTAHVVAMTGSYFRGDAEAVLAPQDERSSTASPTPITSSSTVTNTLSSSTSAISSIPGSYVDDILKVLDPAEKTIIHIPERQFAREHEGQDQGG
jgi:hypothetical protein